MRKLAKNKFKIGDRVFQTPARVVANNWRKRFSGQRFGTVVGFSLDRKCVRVKIDGLNTVGSWAAEFWEVVTPTPKSIDIALKSAHELCKNTNENLLSASPEKIATGSISGQAETEGKMLIRWNPAFESFTVTPVPSDAPLTRETSTEIGGWLSRGWLKLRNFVTGCGSK